jgi:ABC-type multidrug transport system ATPase subunit
VLAGRYNPKEVTVTGDLSYNDLNCSQDGKVKMPPTEIASRVGFCYEGDQLISELTVEQTLKFISDLRYGDEYLPHSA